MNMEHVTEQVNTTGNGQIRIGLIRLSPDSHEPVLMGSCE